MTETMSSPWDSLEGPSTRTPRSLETREVSKRQMTWNRQSLLPEIEPRDGWAFKWVRISDKGKDDKTNFQKRLYEGYEPVTLEDFPELAHESKFIEKTGMVERGGLVLCKIPQEVVDDRTQQLRERTQREMDSAEESYMRDSHELMAKVSKRRRDIVFGR